MSPISALNIIFQLWSGLGGESMVSACNFPSCTQLAWSPRPQPPPREPPVECRRHLQDPAGKPWGMFADQTGSFWCQRCSRKRPCNNSPFLGQHLKKLQLCFIPTFVKGFSEPENNSIMSKFSFELNRPFPLRTTFTILDSSLSTLEVESILRVLNSRIVGVQMEYSSELFFWVGTKFELPNILSLSRSEILRWLNWSLGSFQVRYISNATVMRFFGMSTSKI